MTVNFQAMFEKLKIWQASHTIKSQRGGKQGAAPFCSLITLTYISIHVFCNYLNY